MESNFDQAFRYTIINEGSFSNNPADHSGPTSGYGVTRSELARWRRRPVSIDEVKNMKEDEARTLYYAWYYKPLGLDHIKRSPIVTAMFDCGIIRGIGIPIKYAQSVCNSNGYKLVVDNHSGPLTIAILNEIDVDAFIHGFSARMEKGFRSIVDNDSTQRVFLKGWINRAHRLLTLLPSAAV